MTPPVPDVTVVIPARDAAATVEATLDSLTAQTMPAWEAVVVDDGSRDATRALVERRAAADGRVRVLGHTPSQGVCVARNRGIAAARADLLLFLDADDLLAPEALELLHAALADPRVDAAHAGWARITQDGEAGRAVYAPPLPDLFRLSARSCPFAIHACLVRSSLVARAGGFDPGFVICEDWDLWQRIARAGARFTLVRRPLALYRLRAGSASLDPAGYLAHARRVIANGHAADARVARPDPRHAEGAPRGERAAATLVIGAWVAGAAIAQGRPAGDLLAGLLAGMPDAPPFAVSPDDLADVLLSSVPVGLGRSEAAWPELLAGHLPALRAVAGRLEQLAGSPGLGRRTMRRFEALVADRGGVRGPAVVGGTWVGRWDLEQPPPARAEPACERMSLAVAVQGETLATVQLPLLEGPDLDPGVLADALPDAVVWELLGRHFAQTLLPELRIDRGPDGAGVWRGDVLLADGLPEVELEPRRLHDRVGWTLLLQEVWGRTGWSSERFYAPAASDEPAGPASSAAVRVLDVEDDLPRDVGWTGRVAIELRVAGTSLAIVPVSALGELTDAGVISALTGATGFELCRAVVRGAILGRPLADPTPLRERLRAARALGPQAAGRSPGEPGWEEAVRRAGRPGTPTLVLGRRPGSAGGAAWRRAALPAGALDALREAADARGEPWAVVPAGSTPRAGVYAPDALVAGIAAREVEGSGGGDGPPAADPGGGPGEDAGARTPSPLGGTTSFLRSDFERLFASGADPRRYESAHARRRYEQTMQVIGKARVGRALEVGCAEGHFTVALARRADALVAADISSIALGRTRARCEAAGLHAVEYVRLDVGSDAIPGRFDLIVAGGVLCYLPDREALASALHRLAAALRPGGRLVCAHANLLADDPDRTGFDWEAPYGARVIGDVLAETAGLDVEVELRTPLYRVQSARRARHGLAAWRRRRPRTIDAEAAEPEPEVAARVRVGGGEVTGAAGAGPPSTDGVPILMYHRVTRSGSSALARWRLDPSALDEQLAYLRQAGYVALDLETWTVHLSARTRPPERSVILTFDDAYVDVAEHVAPLLQRHRLTATVFVPTGHVGGTSAWERDPVDRAPIMDWDALRDLAASGVTVASHAVTHRPLTALDDDEVVLEALRSRTALEEQIGRPVSAIAYPYGDHDAVVRHLVGAAGLQIGLTCETRRSHLHDDRLALPRIEIEGTDGLEELVRKLG